MLATRRAQSFVTAYPPRVIAVATAGKAVSRMAPSKVISTIGKGVFVAAVGSAIALGGAAAASAAGGVSVQSGSTVDADGTQGSWAPAVTGDQRALTTHASAGHAITSDACAVERGGYPKDGCLPPASFDPRTISATTGISNDSNSVLDRDGFQTNKGG